MVMVYPRVEDRLRIECMEDPVCAIQTGLPAASSLATSFRESVRRNLTTQSAVPDCPGRRICPSRRLASRSNQIPLAFKAQYCALSHRIRPTVQCLQELQDPAAGSRKSADLRPAPTAPCSNSSLPVQARGKPQYILPQPSKDLGPSAARISAAALGVGARRSATKSAIVKSIS